MPDTPTEPGTGSEQATAPKHHDKKWMPSFLILITGLCFLLGVVAIYNAACKPSYFPYNHLRYVDFWRLGDGCFFALNGIVFISIGQAFRHRKSWGRFLLVVFLPISVLMMTYFSGTISGDIRPIRPSFTLPTWSNAINEMLCDGLLIWYLFFKKSVRDYFGDK